MAHHAPRKHRRRPQVPMHGRRTRGAVAFLGVLVSLGVPVAVLAIPAPLATPVATVETVEAQPTARSSNDSARLGVTGALPGDPLLGTATPSDPPPNKTPSESTRAQSPVSAPPDMPHAPLGIPDVMLDAYQRAARAVAVSQPSCHLPWSVLAAIGLIESGHASQGRVDASGNTRGPILGPRLDGSSGMAAIPDTDHGMLDGDTVWDRAVGPMQFIPSSWRSWGIGNPNNIYDSTLTAGRYLCAGGGDLSKPAQLQAAIFDYNHSATYVSLVLQWAHAYQTGVLPTPSAPGPVLPGNGGRPLPTDAAPPATGKPTAIARPIPVTATPSATTSPPHPPVTTTPVTTASPPPTPTLIPTLIPPTPTPPITSATPTPAPSTPPATVTSPLVSPPTTTTLVEPTTTSLPRSPATPPRH